MKTIQELMAFYESDGAYKDDCGTYYSDYEMEHGFADFLAGYKLALSVGMRDKGISEEIMNVITDSDFKLQGQRMTVDSTPLVLRHKKLDRAQTDGAPTAEFGDNALDFEIKLEVQEDCLKGNLCATQHTHYRVLENLI